ncbi:MAG: dipeptide/oligopeptide/nickel ABC transporter ATP-binding protein [Deltaproteobacteria bacterium CG23_combo_of_CG06-09_8_20_14_all_51_20]|nr:MAG: dipeptide/oligopeptide/nickel ABC transporter ATP-binding protein [Desulfobacteraceae bacterium CG2_30_51_40]PIP44830.1 MAG: dipeptide/oligopeptide/nickel ABC transporter ATP-binding protein [Deltaproteobacteria bacterium CG23_combo_of_CG06-09_8_20_14_all_51_20]
MKEETGTSFLSFDGVSKFYLSRGRMLGGSGRQVVALNRLTLDIRKGEIFGLVGESGSGKTTAGRLIVRLEEADRGIISVEGQDVTHLKGKRLKDFRKRVQMIFQDPYQSLNPQLSVLDTVSEPLLIHRVGDRLSRAEMVMNALQSVGLSPPGDFVHRFPHQMSGGQRQRVAIARAMVLRPDFVVADEPTSMLDASISAQIFNILLEMQKSLGITLLFITHSLAAARYLCDRIAVIYRGNLMELGPADDVIQRSRHPYTRALIDALPKFGQCGETERFNTFLKAERESSSTVGCAFFGRCSIANRILCSQEVPPFKTVSPGRRVACFFAEEQGKNLTASKTCHYGI